MVRQFAGSNPCCDNSSNCYARHSTQYIIHEVPSEGCISIFIRIISCCHDLFMPQALFL